MGANFGRFFVESPGNTILSGNYNGEFDNILTNFTPDGMDDYSVNVAQMQTTVDPGEVGTESLATSTAGELERIRHMLNEIIGKNQWYESPAINLELLAGSEQKLHIGLEFEGSRGGASSTTDALAKFINQGGIINAASLSSADVAIADFGTTNVKFGKYSYSMASGNVLAFPGHHGNPVKGSLSLWHRNSAATEYLAYNPLLGLELFLDASGFLNAKITEKGAASEVAKTTNSVTGSVSRAGDSSFNNIVMKWRANDENGASTDILELERNGVDEGTQITGDDLDINSGNGGVWFLGCGRNDPAWDHFSAMSVLPSAEAVNAWSANGNTAGNSVTNGVLNISGQTGIQSNNYRNTVGIDLTQFTVEWKMKLNSGEQSSVGNDDKCSLIVRDDSIDRSVGINFFNGKLEVNKDAAADTNIADIFIDTTQYHVYRLTSVGPTNPVTKLYIDGQLVLEFTNDASDTSASDLILFGDTNTDSGENSNSDWEYVAYYDAGAEAPIVAGSQGELDSVGIVSEVISDATVALLQSSKVTDVFRSSPSYGPTLPPIMCFDRNSNSSTTSASFEDIGQFVYYVAGDGITEHLFRFSASIESSLATAITRAGIDIDDDEFGVTGTRVNYGGVTIEHSGANDVYMGTATRYKILTPGLHEIRPVFSVSAGQSDLNSSSSMWECGTRKKEDLS